jgi:hypothetical protein
MNKSSSTTPQRQKPVVESLGPHAAVCLGVDVIDLTAPEHQHSEAVVLAAQWLADQNPPPDPVVPTLRARFDLSALEACEAAAMAQRFRIVRRAHG